MPQLLWDASGLAKRYYTEAGSETVHALFGFSPLLSMTVTYIGYAETAAILRRKRNSRHITAEDFQSSRLFLRTEVLFGSQFGLLTVDDTDFLNGIALTDRHNLNTSDAAILSAYLRYAQAQAVNAPVCILVASDQRLLRAAASEGLQILNPERVSDADVPPLLAQSG